MRRISTTWLLVVMGGVVAATASCDRVKKAFETPDAGADAGD